MKTANFFALLLAVFFMLGGWSFFLDTDVTHAQEILDKLGNAKEEAKLGGNSIGAIVGIVVKSILGVLGLIFMGFIITGGFQWMTAAGEEKKLHTAQGMISHAAIGLAIVVCAYIITVFVINTLSSAAGI